jgi:hypothetical protein
MQGDAELDFAYKYPFSGEAKSVIDRMQITKIEQRYLNASRGHIEAAAEEGIEYKGTSMREVKTGYLIIYAYSRMLLSAVKNAVLTGRYAAAEAGRSARALAEAEPGEMERLVGELGLNARIESQGNSDNGEEATLRFGVYDFLRYATKVKGLDLVNQRLSNGAVLMKKNMALRLLEKAMEGEIAGSLPISASQLPREVVEYSKTARFALRQTVSPARYAGRESWIDKLLQTPIPDIRHRSVNLILAPYLVNTKGMSVDQATKTIEEYIERCKQLDPGTRINERYIRYQCEYAKRRGLKPLSLDKARELLSGAMDVNALA